MTTREVPRELFDALLTLARAIARSRMVLLNRGLVVQRMGSHIRPRVTLFNYSNGHVVVEREAREVERPLFYWAHLIEPSLISHDLDLPGYRESLRRFADLDVVHPNGPRSTMDSFLHLIINLPQHQLRVRPLEHTVRGFLLDLRGVPREYLVQAWLVGVWMTGVRHKIHPAAILRRPRRSDFEEIESTPTFDWREPFEPLRRASAVLEVRQTVTHGGFLQRTVEKLLDALRLFDLGSVQYIQYIGRGGHGPGSRSRLGPGAVIAPFAYCLDPTEIPRVRNLISSLFTVIPDRVFSEPSKKLTPVRVALDRYVEAVIARTSAEGRIASAVGALEALLLQESEDGELKRRLGQRASVLLSRFGGSALEFNERIQQAYKVRSSYVHGSVRRTSAPAENDILARIVLNYCRVAIAVQMQLTRMTPREEIIQLLDDTLLSRQAEKAFRSKCEGIAVTRFPPV